MQASINWPRLVLILTLLLLLFIKNAEAAVKVTPLGYKTSKPKICLNMIVKNEAHVITRCLESTLPIIDYWVIVDTGSSDETQKVIRDFMKEKNIPGELHESTWVNFCRNRQEALDLAKFKADYILFMDADDILSYADDFKLPHLVHDCYMLNAKAGATEYMLTRIVKANLDWRWEGALHEYVSSKYAKNGALLKGIDYIYICDGARSKDPEKYLKDAQILLDALKEEPENARYMFYLAQTYASGHDHENALKYYQKRVEMGGWDQEVFWSMMQIAQLKKVLGCDRALVNEAFLNALKYRPSRPEPYYFLAVDARANNEFEKGYEIARQGIQLKETTDTLFAEKWTYSTLLLEFSACAAVLEKYDEGVAACDRLLSKGNVDPQIRVLAQQNLDYCQEQLKTQSILKAVDAVFDEG